MQAVIRVSSFSNQALFFLLAITLSQLVIADEAANETELADVEVTATKRNSTALRCACH